MRQDDDRDYYAGRAHAARHMERQAASAMVAAIHAEMASRYERLAAGLAIYPAVIANDNQMAA